jgi:hypothetical protein
VPPISRHHVRLSCAIAASCVLLASPGAWAQAASAKVRVSAEVLATCTAQPPEPPSPRRDGRLVLGCTHGVQPALSGEGVPRAFSRARSMDDAVGLGRQAMEVVLKSPGRDASGDRPLVATVLF